jgi:hypothetical protein
MYHFREMNSEPKTLDAPPVNPADLLAAWMAVRDLQSHNTPDQPISIDSRSLEQFCSPDADIHAVWTRTAMLEILTHVLPDWWKRSKRDKIVEIAARFPMKLMQPGIEKDQPPFDVRGFMKQIAAS